jgi:hypothetical protein
MPVKMLTRDHVPPKSAADNTGSKNLFFPWKELSLRSPQMGIRGDGYWQRTLCSDCNNKILGSKCDPALACFSKKVKEISETYKNVAASGFHYHFSIKPNLVAKAIIGHSLASDMTRANDEELCCLRKFFLGQSEDLLGHNIFYWFYPYDHYEIHNDLLIPLMRGQPDKGVVRIRLLNFYPLAFMVAQCESYDGLPKLNYKAYSEKVVIDIKRVMPPMYPANIVGNNYVLVGEAGLESVLVTNRNKK